MSTIYRKAIRAVMLTPERGILLIQAKEPASDFVVWFAPGGGIENGETPEECLCREIREETGLILREIGPHIWNRQHVFDWNGQMIDQTEAFYFVPVERFTPSMQGNPAETELMAFECFKWWTLEEIDQSPDVFAPRLLTYYLSELLSYGLPDVPVDVGV